MKKYTSGRQRDLKIGISSYSENLLSLEVIGNTNISGVTTSSGGFVGDLTGTATTAITAGYASTAGISTVAQGLTGTPNLTVGIVTASSFIGDLTGTATTATNVIGGIGSVRSLTVSGFSTFSSIGVSTDLYDSTNSKGVDNYVLTATPTGILWQSVTSPGIGAISGINVAPSSNNSFFNVALLNINTGTTANAFVSPSGLVFNPFTGNLGIGTTNPTSKLTVFGDGLFTGIVTASKFVGDASGLSNVGLASTAIKLRDIRTFEITGDIVAAPQDFDGTQNVSLASSIQPNSVGLGTYTYGDYVKNITGTIGEIEVSVTSGEGVSPQIGLPDNVIISSNLTVGNDVQINNNLNVNGNITIGGTSAYLIVNDFRVKDKDIILGFTTDSNGNDVSTDVTANHGGISVASTEGSPLVELYNPGVGETSPATYKKIMWFKSGSFTGLNTDAWLINYAVGIGSTQFPSGTRLAAGSVQFTENDLAVVRNINASGIITGSTFRPSSGYYQSANGTNSFYVYDGTGNVAFQGTIGASQINNASGYKVIGFAATDATFENNIYVAGLTSTSSLKVSGFSTFSSIGISTDLYDSTNSRGTDNFVLTSTPGGILWQAVTSPGIGAISGINVSSNSNNNSFNVPFLNVSAGTTSNAFVSASDLTFNPFRGNLGIGTTNPTSKLTVYGDGLFTGVVTATKFIGDASGVVNVGSAITATNVIGGIGSITSLTVSGVTTTGILNVGTSGTIITTTSGGLVGIGTTNPTSRLQVQGNILVSGIATISNVSISSSIFDSTNSSGLDQYVLTSTPTGILWRSTPSPGINVLSSSTNASFNIPFLNIGIGTTSNVFTAPSELNYNPSTKNVGIGTSNSNYKLDIGGDTRISGNLYVNDIITKGADTEQIVLTSSGVLTTTSLGIVTVDSFGITTYRSAKYIVQITSNNSLGIGTTTSIKNLTRGLNYFPGTYSNIPLISSTGIGTNAVATITVLPQFTLGITTCSAGTFTFTGSAVGMTTGQTLTFNQTLNILPLEQSKLTGIQLNSSGFGYTTFPTITVQAPIIAGNPVSGVGVGSTALAAVTSMNVQNFNITVGIATTAIPTVTFSSPSVGTTATGIVGVGVSQISVVNVGSGYSVSPTISISKVTGFSGSVGLGISSLNWQTTSGSGYTLPTITINGDGGIGTGAVIEADVDSNAPNGLINFRITNVGLGYTRPPTVSISDATGVGATVTITRMTVSNAVVNNIGRGSTTGISTSDIIVSSVGGIGSGAVLSASLIVPTNVVITNVGSGYTLGNIPVTATFSNPSIGATVGLGVGIVTITSPGIGYTVLPTLTFSSPTLGIGSTATGSSNKLGYDQTALFNGPGLANTTAVYYVQPLTSNTFGISTTSGGSRITLGYGVTPSTTRASIGGTVSTVDITFGGSGYAIDNIITASNFDLPRVDTNVGTGFSFRVNSTVNAFQISDLLVLQTASGGNSNAFVIESSGISDTDDLGEFSADISGNNARLRFTPVYANNNIKFFKTLFRM